MLAESWPPAVQMQHHTDHCQQELLVRRAWETKVLQRSFGPYDPAQQETCTLNTAVHILIAYLLDRTCCLSVGPYDTKLTSTKGVFGSILSRLVTVELRRSMPMRCKFPRVCLRSNALIHNCHYSPSSLFKNHGKWLLLFFVIANHCPQMPVTACIKCASFNFHPKG